MTQISKRILSVTLTFLLVLSLLIGGLPTQAEAVSTGYTSSTDVHYVPGKYVANWGARNELCEFLSPFANGFYTTDYSYDTLSQLTGGSNESTAPHSDLYKALQNLMQSQHTHITTYDETRYQYMYTDCQLSDTTTISTFYTMQDVNSTWDSGKTYNREHIWPKSKCINQSKAQDSADLMLLRPENPSANSSRGNKGYGLSSGFMDPGESVRGDCARMILYCYVRWGNTSYMWGSSGVIENLDILLQWMEEDPVDTWEMGRNDAVQSITGTRNVFVDYPEYAWLLFGKDVPANMSTPSKNDQGGVSASPSDYKTNGSNSDNNNSGNGNSGSTTNDVNWVSAPSAETPYQLAYVQTNKGNQTYYFNGTLSSDGYYLGTTTNVSEAKDIYLESVSGGYRLYFKDGSNTKYLKIYASGSHVNAGIGSVSEASVFTWDNTYHTFVTSVSGVKYFLGTYSTYTSISACNYESYISSNIIAKPCGEKTGNSTVTPPVTEPTTTPTATPTTTPTESTGATEPTVSTDPTDPTDTTQPTETVDPTDPVEPTETVLPSETMNPTDGTQPSTTKPAETTPTAQPGDDATSPVVLIVCIAIAVAAIGGACYYFLVYKKKNNG